MIGHLLRDAGNIAAFQETDDYGVGSYTVGADVRCAVMDQQGRIIKDLYGSDVVINKKAIIAVTDTNGDAIVVSERDMFVYDGNNYEIANFSAKRNTRMDIKSYELFLISSKKTIG